MRFHRLTVTDVRTETADTISLALAPAPADQARFAFQPGQYLTLRTHLAGEELRRSYSICSSPEDGELRIAVKRVEDGRFSAWAHQALRPDHWLEAMPPAGRFTAPAELSGLHVGVAAGSGITPVLSILKSVLSRGTDSRFVLLYGNRSSGQIIFRDQLEALKDRFMGRLTVAHVLSREQQDVPVLNGRLDGPRVMALLRAWGPVPAIGQAYLCGPDSMIDGVSATLAAAGLDPARIRSERFTTGAAPPPRPARPRPASAAPYAVATITADGVRTEVPMHEHETVLDAALRAGLDLPYSCRGGMCSTCRARLTDGNVRMAVNYGLEPWETAAGFVLTCQAFPTVGRVAVDFDHV